MKCRHCVNRAVAKIGHSYLCKFHLKEQQKIWEESEAMLKKEAPVMFNALLTNVKRRKHDQLVLKRITGHKSS